MNCYIIRHSRHAPTAILPSKKFTTMSTHTTFCANKLRTRSTVLSPVIATTKTTTTHNNNSDGSINGHFRHCQRNLFIFINFRNKNENVYEFSSFRFCSPQCICLPLFTFLQYITFDVDLVFALFQSDCKYFTSVEGFSQYNRASAHSN